VRAVFSLFLSAALLAGCAGQSATNFDDLAQRAGLGGGALRPLLLERENGDKELSLEAADVWDDAGAGAAAKWNINGEDMFFRLRPVGVFERATARLGLFWHSRVKKPILTIVILGDPVNIRGVRVKTDNASGELQRAKNFVYTPAKRMFDKDASSAAFYIEPSLLRALTQGENAHVTALTNRGQLRLNLSAVPKVGEGPLAGSAKALFAEFLKMRRQAGGGD
jgi:hypothetical protein